MSFLDMGKLTVKKVYNGTKDKKTWVDASKACRYDCGWLLEMITRKENEALKTYIINSKDIQFNQECAIELITHI